MIEASITNTSCSQLLIDQPKRRSNLPVLQGGGLEIGMLYNAMSDQPILGKNLFNDPIRKKRQEVNTKYSVITESKISERLHGLDIEAGLGMSFLAGLFKVRVLVQIYVIDHCKKFASTLHMTTIGPIIYKSIYYIDL